MAGVAAGEVEEPGGGQPVPPSRILGVGTRRDRGRPDLAAEAPEIPGAVATAISGWSFAAVGKTVTTLEPDRSSNHASSGAAGGCHSAPPTRASVPLTFVAPGYPVNP